MPATRTRLTKAAVLVEVEELRKTIDKVFSMSVAQIEEDYKSTYSVELFEEFHSGGMCARAVDNHRQLKVLAATYRLTMTLGVE